MKEQNQNSFRVESHGDPASGSLAVKAAGSPCDHSHPFAEYDSATGTFVVRPPVAEPRPFPEPPAPCAMAEADLSSVALAEEEASAEPNAEPAPPAAHEPEPPPPAEPESAVGALVGPIDASDDLAEIVPFERQRADGWTAARQRRFLEELADCGMIREAAARVGMSRKSAWQLRRRAEGTAFASTFEAALQDGARRLQSIAFARAVEGVAKPVFYRGRKVGEQRVYDNRLLLSLIAKIPASAAVKDIPSVLADWEGWLDAVEQERHSPAPDIADADGHDSPVWRDEDGCWWTGFPAPDGFAGTVEGSWHDGDYRRTLTDGEIAMIEAEDEASMALSAAERDAFFAPDK